VLKNRQVILLAIEPTYNGIVTPTPAADAILVENLSVSDSELKLIQRPTIEASLATRASIFGGRLKEITFDVELKGSGTAGTPPEVGQALRACSMGETIAPGTSVIYAPVSTGQESAAIWRYLDGRLEKFSGIRGEVAFALETGNKGMASFTLTGHFVDAADTPLPAPTYDTSLPVPNIGGAFAIGGYGAIINAMNVSLSNTIATAPDFNSSDGFGEVRITKRDVQGSFDPEDVLVATNDFDGQFIANTAMALTTGPIGTVAGNIITFDLPAVSYRARGEGERDGVQTLDMGFGAADVSGDDGIVITFT